MACWSLRHGLSVSSLSVVFILLSILGIGEVRCCSDVTFLIRSFGEKEEGDDDDDSDDENEWGGEGNAMCTGGLEE